MIQQAVDLLPSLYESDETAWLDVMSELIHQGRLDELDYAHLGEYLTDMARRDRREVESRLAILIAHLLKWTKQSAKRSRSWRRTIVVQRQELVRELGRGVLRNHAEAVLPEVYAAAVEQAVTETGLPAETFPDACPYTLDQLLSPDILGE
jgi:hypothetical protein